MSWSRKLEDPITLPDGRTLRTLGDAGAYLVSLPAKTRQSEAVQTAAEALLMAKEGRGPLMHARIGVLRVINAGQPDRQVARRRKAAKRYTIVESL